MRAGSPVHIRYIPESADVLETTLAVSGNIECICTFDSAGKAGRASALIVSSSDQDLAWSSGHLLLTSSIEILLLYLAVLALHETDCWLILLLMPLPIFCHDELYKAAFLVPLLRCSCWIR